MLGVEMRGELKEQGHSFSYWYSIFIPRSLFIIKNPLFLCHSLETFKNQGHLKLLSLAQPQCGAVLGAAVHLIDYTIVQLLEDWTLVFRPPASLWKNLTRGVKDKVNWRGRMWVQSPIRTSAPYTGLTHLECLLIARLWKVLVLSLRSCWCRNYTSDFPSNQATVQTSGSWCHVVVVVSSKRPKSIRRKSTCEHEEHFLSEGLFWH